MITASQFRPLWWLSGPHGQTLWPIWVKRPLQNGRAERLELDDGDFLDLVWCDGEGPLVIVCHGLEGSIDSHYASAIMNALRQSGYQALFWHFRGCSGEPNRLNRAYHSGETGDLEIIIRHATRVTGKRLYALIGYSLGGNMLLKWLGESGKQAEAERAVAVSVPFDLAECARRLTGGISRIYQSHLLKRMRAGYKRKFGERRSPLGINVDELENFFDFDDQVTAPLHGFDGVGDYYGRSSCRQYLQGIRRDTLIIHALDDPFMYPDTVPREEELSESVTLELAQKGGHVGFISGRIRPERWLEGRILRFLDEGC